jgi:hypothetical protein
VEDEEITSNETDMAFSIVSLTFKEDNKWRLNDGNSTISAYIADDEFKKKVASNAITFSKDDILRCRVKITQRKTLDGLKNDYIILKVKEHLPAYRQLILFNDNPSS